VDSADGRRWLDYFVRTSRAEGLDTVVTPAEADIQGAPLLTLRPNR
jgi:hypothetical protein